ncbi:MAG: hypothetical protein EOO05_18145 [Chitinophagaceae bacterium]|nr:MAG: hypothetical protein EOO05_18145 [Chitinophagaceae bacterium]
MKQLIFVPFLFLLVASYAKKITVKNSVEPQAVNKISNSNARSILLSWYDVVRARHTFNYNQIEWSGEYRKYQFVTDSDNTVK